MIRKDRRRASTDARLELRRQLVELRAMGKTMVEISAITGYARTYCSTLLKKLTDEPLQWRFKGRDPARYPAPRSERAQPHDPGSPAPHPEIPLPSSKILRARTHPLRRLSQLQSRRVNSWTGT